MLNIKIKHGFFRYYGFVALLIFLFMAFYFYRTPKDKDDITLFLTSVGGLAYAIYSIQKQKLEELRLFKELFTDFNKRYDDLNDILNDIVLSKQTAQLTDDEIKHLNDYFNLCGEEFLFYQKGYIYPEVWTSWHNGMKIFIDNDKRIKKHWEQEKKSDSYYRLDI
jgi:hypothetical protein